MHRPRHQPRRANHPIFRVIGAIARDRRGRLVGPPGERDRVEFVGRVVGALDRAGRKCRSLTRARCRADYRRPRQRGVAATGWAAGFQVRSLCPACRPGLLPASLRKKGARAGRRARAGRVTSRGSALVGCGSGASSRGR
jgi:hypothetical protein